MTRQAAGGLIGRDRDLGFLREFVRQAAAGGGALVLSGDPGMGKTALLNALAESAAAAGTVVLRVTGAEFEGEISFAGLNQVLLPVLGDVDELDAVHRDALRVALGFGTGPPPDRLLVSNAVLVLLQRVAARGPPLLIVDDLPWIDRASAGVLSFVARRLVGRGAGLLVACRTGADSYFDRAGLPEYELTPLDGTAATELVAARFPGLDPLVRSRVLGVAQGNPLALLELPEALSDSQRSAAEPLPSVLPLGQRLQKLFTSRVTRLPPATRSLLLVAALEGTGDLRVLTAAGSGDYRLEDLAPAERDHLVRVGQNPGRVSFRHPLIRSAAVEASTAAERRRAHQAVAAVLAGQPERRAWHLGEAAVAPDEHVAALLEEAAHPSHQRGDYLGAVAGLTRAAGLSPAAAERGRRLAEAAYIGAEALGEVRGTSRLLAESRIHLEAALVAFRELGAAPWAARAELELRATGLTRTSPGAPGAAALTPQELQIARLAASGLTNKQIAGRLFLSPRTVGGHLYQIFPKLGITSRAALRDALGPPGDS